MKICKKCNKNKELSYFRKRKRSKDGLDYQCRDCRKIIDDLYYEGHKEEKVAYQFKNQENIAIQKSIYYEKNKEDFSSYNHNYYEANIEEMAKQHARYYAENRKEILIQKSSYQKENPGKVNAISAQYRAAKIQRTPAWLSEEHRRRIEIIYTESSRLTKETGILHHVDHIIPLQGESVSGLHVPWNLQILPAYGVNGNCSKGNKY